MHFKSIVKAKGQKPSSARPTQLSANAEEAITATEAKVAIALTDDITELHSRRCSSGERLLPKQGRNGSASILSPSVTPLLQRGHRRR
jgi:hypothetical protein